MLIMDFKPRSHTNLLKFLTINIILVNYDYRVFLFVYNVNYKVQTKISYKPLKLLTIRPILVNYDHRVHNKVEKTKIKTKKGN